MTRMTPLYGKSRQTGDCDITRGLRAGSGSGSGTGLGVGSGCGSGAGFGYGTGHARGDLFGCGDNNGSGNGYGDDFATSARRGGSGRGLGGFAHWEDPEKPPFGTLSN